MSEKVMLVAEVKEPLALPNDQPTITFLYLVGSWKKNECFFFYLKINCYSFKNFNS